jgi:hypothetical protein
MKKIKLPAYLKNPTTLLVIALLIMSALFLQQCQSTRNEEAKRKEMERIANQNLLAMNDSTVQLKMTREQLAKADKELAARVSQIDSLTKALGNKKDKVREVIVVKTEIVHDSANVANTARKDSTDSTKYHLDFAVNDSVKSFIGTSSFHVKKEGNNISIKGDTTRIRDFRLNFDIVVVKYEDPVAKVTRYRIVPQVMDSAGQPHILSENQVKFSFRGAELLDRPWQENVPPGQKKKWRLTGAWGVGLNPISVYPVVTKNTVRLGYAPSVSFGYFITFMKR